MHASPKKRPKPNAKQVPPETERPTTESSGSIKTYDKSIERQMLLGEKRAREAQDAQDAQEARTKQREEDQFSEVPSYLSEEDMWSDEEAAEASWRSDDQADAMEQESWPILQDLLFGGRGVSEMIVSHI